MKPRGRCKAPPCYATGETEDAREQRDQVQPQVPLWCPPPTALTTQSGAVSTCGVSAARSMPRKYLV